MCTSLSALSISFQAGSPGKQDKESSLAATFYHKGRSYVNRMRLATCFSNENICWNAMETCDAFMHSAKLSDYYISVSAPSLTSVNFDYHLQLSSRIIDSVYTMDCVLILGAIGAVGKLVYDVSGRAKHQLEFLMDEPFLHLKPTATTTWEGGTSTGNQPPSPAPIRSFFSIPNSSLLELPTFNKPGPSLRVVFFILLITAFVVTSYFYASDCWIFMADLIDDHFEETLDSNEPAVHGQVPRETKTISPTNPPPSPRKPAKPYDASNILATPINPPITAADPATSPSTSKSSPRPVQTLSGPEIQGLGATSVPSPEVISPDTSHRPNLNARILPVFNKANARSIGIEQPTKMGSPQDMLDSDGHRPRTPEQSTEEVQPTINGKLIARNSVDNF